MAFSIRQLSNVTSYMVTLFVNGIPTSFTAIILNGSTSFSAVSTGNVILNQLDLITLKITFSGSALNNGACATLITN